MFSASPHCFTIYGSKHHCLEGQCSDPGMALTLAVAQFLVALYCSFGLCWHEQNKNTLLKLLGRRTWMLTWQQLWWTGVTRVYGDPGVNQQVLGVGVTGVTIHVDLLTPLSLSSYWQWRAVWGEAVLPSRLARHWRPSGSGQGGEQS